MMAMDGEALAPQMPHIEPPEGSGWQLHSPYGAQRFKDGPDGRLVRLAPTMWFRSLLQRRNAVCYRTVYLPEQITWLLVILELISQQPIESLPPVFAMRQSAQTGMPGNPQDHTGAGLTNP